MKHSATFLLCILTLAAQTFAQGGVNANERQRFNGIWVFDVKKSDPSFKDLYEGQILEIAFNQPELKIVNTQTRMNETKSATVIFYTDDRGEKNRPYPFNEKLEVESNTVWDEAILIRKYTIKFYKSGKVVGGNTTQQAYAISEDGNTLTIIEESRSKISTDSPYGKLNTDGKGKIKLVYKRKV